MSQFDEFDEFDDDDDESSASNGPEALRKAHRKLQRDFKALKTDLDTANNKLRVYVVGDVLKEKGFDPAIAGLIPTTVESTPEAVAQWTETYGKFFTAPGAGEQVKQEATPEGERLPETTDGTGFYTPEEVAAIGKAAGVDGAGLTATGLTSIEDQIKAAKTWDELQAVLQQAG